MSNSSRISKATNELDRAEKKTAIFFGFNRGPIQIKISNL